MPNDEFVTLDNLGRFKQNVDGELAGKADVSDVYDKTEVGTLLSGKQDALTAGQLANIADIPNKQAQLTASQLAELNATAIPNGVIDAFLNVSQVLENNSWETIKVICQAGQAGNYWALGDTKNISVTLNGVAANIPHAIVDMTAGRYEYASDNTKHTNVVFQAVPTIGNYAFNSSSNVSPNGDAAYNGWDYSNIRAIINSGTIYRLYDSSFTALLEQVKTMAAYSGKTDTLVYSSDKFFLPAAREVKANYTSSVQPCEISAITQQYGYYAQNSDANANRIKYSYGSASTNDWWLRSPISGTSYNVRFVGSMYGTMNNNDAISNYGIAPCFAF